MSGPRAALEPGGGSADGTQHRYRGERLGLPESGVGSIPSTARRAVAMLIDCVLAALITGLFTMPDLPRNWSILTWFLIGVIAVSFFGFTPGMYAMGVRVARIDGSAMVGVPRAMLRTLLVGFIIPVVVWDYEYRGLHDRLAGTVVVRMR
ncbi:RDD family protein [Kutzneria kofuensis]